MAEIQPRNWRGPRCCRWLARPSHGGRRRDRRQKRRGDRARTLDAALAAAPPGRLWLLDSGSGRFGWIEPASGRFEEVCFCPGYETVSPVRYVTPEVFERAPRHHAGGFTGLGLLPDEVPIIARRGELVVPPDRIVRDEKSQREQRPITVMINVTAADANSFRASQGQIATDMARAVDRASRNR